jgi:acyl-CoA dehydrogenase
VRAVAAAHADEVDRQARFPSEAVAALRSTRLLSAALPVKLGGLGCSLAEIAALCQVVAEGCAAAGMIFAMHQIQVGCLLRHAGKSPFFGRYLRALPAEQRLIASVTSEVGVGGSLRTSVAAVEPGESGHTLRKQATTVSYGLQADDLLITARRAGDAAAGDQVLLLVHRDQCTLTPQGAWDTLGMRGTCSPPLTVEASFAPGQILATPFADIAAQTMVPLSHLLWSACWLGIATDAVARARAAVQAEARRSPGVAPPAAARLAEVSELLQRMRANLDSLLADYELARRHDPEALTSVGFALRINQLKLASSQLVIDIVGRALQICGIAGYREGTRFSVGRHLRDAYSAPLMIANDRILATNAALLLVHKGA